MALFPSSARAARTAPRTAASADGSPGEALPRRVERRPGFPPLLPPRSFFPQSWESPGFRHSPVQDSERVASAGAPLKEEDLQAREIELDLR